MLGVEVGGCPWAQDQQQSSKASPRQRQLVSLCQLPFVLNPEAKARIMQGEALLQKQHQAQAWTIQVIIQQAIVMTTPAPKQSVCSVALSLYVCGNDGFRTCLYRAALSVQQNNAQDGAVL